MLRARAVREVEEQVGCCAACGMEHNPDRLYFAIFEEEIDCLGCCEFRLCPGGAEIVTVKPKVGTYDDEAMFILGKATLNFLDLMGIKQVIYSGDDTKHAKLMEYLQRDGVWTLNLEGYFDGHCHCGHGKKGE